MEVIQNIALINTDNINPKPFTHQLEAAKFLLLKKKALIADEMGAGKTKSAILSATSLKGKKLIICPATLKLNWKKEIKQVDTNAKITIVSGNGYSNNGDDWIIINYDIINRNIEKILDTDFICLICDEAHYIKNIDNCGKPGSKRAEAVLKIAKKMEYVFCLTGTPIPNHTKDIFNILKCIGHPLGDGFSQFAKRYCSPKYNGYGWDFNGSSHNEELNELLLTKMLRRTKEQLLDLPQKIRSFIPVKINHSEYVTKINEYMEAREKFNVEGEHLVYLNAIRKFLAYQKIKNTIDFTKNLIGQDQQVVIFTNYTKVVDDIFIEFGDIAIKITGEQTPEQKQNAVDKFQDGNKKIAICNIIAGGTGITLTKAITVVFNDYSWLPSDHAQAEDRIHRIGQTEKCTIYYMFAENTFDEDITNMLSEKLLNINKIVDNLNVSFLDLVKKAI